MVLGAIHFIFSDEAGVYGPDPTPRFLKANPFYSRAAVGLSAEDWIRVRAPFEAAVARMGLSADEELKWCYVQSVMQHRARRQTIPAGREYSWCARYSDDELLGFVREALGLLRDASSAWGVLTFTSNARYQRWTEDTILRWHVQELMQRAEMHLRPRDALGVVFLDQTSTAERNLHLRNGYAELYRTGDFIKRYRHVKDSLAFELSHHSFGISLADYVAGAFNGWLRGFEVSTELFADLVLPILRRAPSGQVQGWGIREVPSSNRARECLAARLASPAVAERWGG